MANETDVNHHVPGVPVKNGTHDLPISVWARQARERSAWWQTYLRLQGEARTRVQDTQLSS
jgi:hypothetical protein